MSGMMSSRSAHDRTLDNVHFAADTNSAPAKKLVRQQTGRWDMAAATGGSNAEGAVVQLTSADELVAAQAEAAAACAAMATGRHTVRLDLLGPLSRKRLTFFSQAL